MQINYKINFFFITLIIFLLFVVSIFFSFKQASNIKKIHKKIINSEMSKLNFDIKKDQHGNISIIPGELFGEFQKIGDPIHQQFADQEYILIKLNFKNCKKDIISPLIKYDFNEKSKNKRLDFSRRVKLDKKTLLEDSYISFPVYSTKKDDYNSFFHSIVFQNDEFECFENIYKLDNYKISGIRSFSYFGDKPPSLLLFKKPNFQIGNFEFNEIKNNLSLNFLNLTKDYIEYSYTEIKNQQTPWNFLFHGKRGCKLNNCSFPNNCKINRKSILLEGTPEQVCSIDTDIIFTKKLKMKKNSYIYINGSLIAGQLNFNLFNEKNFFDSVKINKKGNFNILIKVPFNDFFRLSVSNNINLYNYSENNFSLNEIKIFNQN